MWQMLGVIERRDGVNLALEAVAEAFRGDFDGHLAPHARIARGAHRARGTLRPCRPRRGAPGSRRGRAGLRARVTWLGREIHASDEVQAAGIAADGVEPWVYSQPDHPPRAILVSRFQVFQSLIFLLQPDVDNGYVVGRDVAMLRL